MLDYFQKSIIPAFVKTMQIKHLSSTPVFNNLIKLMKNLDEKSQCKRFCFISVQALLRFF